MTRRIRKDPNIEIRTRGPQILHPPRTSRRRAGGGRRENHSYHVTATPGLNEMGQRVYMFDGYVDRGYTKPVQGVIPVNDPTSILEEPDSFLIIDHVNPGLEDDSALMETVRESDARIPIILSVQLVPDREQWSAWAELDIMVPSLRPSAVPHTTASRSVVRSPQNRRNNCNSFTIRKGFPDGRQET